jgi:hypothetical protein
MLSFEKDNWWLCKIRDSETDKWQFCWIMDNKKDRQLMSKISLTKIFFNLETWNVTLSALKTIYVVVVVRTQNKLEAAMWLGACLAPCSVPHWHLDRACWGVFSILCFNITIWAKQGVSAACICFYCNPVEHKEKVALFLHTRHTFCSPLLFNTLRNSIETEGMIKHKTPLFKYKAQSPLSQPINNTNPWWLPDKIRTCKEPMHTYT